MYELVGVATHAPIEEKELPIQAIELLIEEQEVQS